jgi:hypothetical protein
VTCFAANRFFTGFFVVVLDSVDDLLAWHVLA